MPPVKNLSYDFLRRHYPHQVKGSKFDYFLSACYTSSPVFICKFSIKEMEPKIKRMLDNTGIKFGL